MMKKMMMVFIMLYEKIFIMELEVHISLYNKNFIRENNLNN